MHQGVALGTFDHLDRDVGVLPSIFNQKIAKEAAGDHRMNADAQTPAFPRCRHAGCLHRVVELVDSCRNSFHEPPTSFRQPDSASVALKQEKTKLFLQVPDAAADTGLGDSKYTRCMAEAHMFGNG